MGMLFPEWPGLISSGQNKVDLLNHDKRLTGLPWLIDEASAQRSKEFALCTNHTYTSWCTKTRFENEAKGNTEMAF